MKEDRMHRRTERRRRKRLRELWRDQYQVPDSETASNDILDDILPESLKPYKFFIWMHFLDHL